MGVNYNKIGYIQESKINRELRRFNQLMESSIGNVKPLITEQESVTTINLSDGNYFGEGSGYEYEIKDSKGVNTGYTVKAKVGIRGYIENDPLTIKSGVVSSQTWGDGGEYTFKDVGYKPQAPAKTVTSKISEGIQNVSPSMIQNPPFKGTFSGYVFGGEYDGVNYQWDATGVDGMEKSNGTLTGTIETENNSYLKKYRITDADPTGTFVGFSGSGVKFVCYKTTANTMACKTVGPTGLGF